MPEVGFPQFLPSFFLFGYNVDPYNGLLAVNVFSGRNFFERLIMAPACLWNAMPEVKSKRPKSVNH